MLSVIQERRLYFYHNQKVGGGGVKGLPLTLQVPPALQMGPVGGGTTDWVS